MSGISSVFGITICQYFVQTKVVSLVKLSRFHVLEKLIFTEAFDEFTSNFAFAKKGCSFEHLNKFSLGFLIIIKHLIESS